MSLIGKTVHKIPVLEALYSGKVKPPEKNEDEA